jgi:CRP/FNR family transcriptional regulator, cyclic AMP receptor protein
MPHQRIEWIKKVPIFTRVNHEALLPIVDISEEIPYLNEAIIFLSDEPADALYIIKEGSVRIEQNYRDGRKKTLAVLTPGNFFGEMALITEAKRCASAICSSDSVLIRLSKDTFLNCLRNNGEACFGILQVLCQRLQSADREISTLTFQNLPGRIAYKLIELAEQFGQFDEHGLTIQLSLTHYDLADMVGTNRESVSKFLAKFKKEKSITTHKRFITILDRNKLLTWT